MSSPCLSQTPINSLKWEWAVNACMLHKCCSGHLKCWSVISTTGVAMVKKPSSQSDLVQRLQISNWQTILTLTYLANPWVLSVWPLASPLLFTVMLHFQNKDKCLSISLDVVAARQIAFAINRCKLLEINFSNIPWSCFPGQYFMFVMETLSRNLPVV